MKMKKFLCSGFRAVCLWNVLVDPSAKASECFLFVCFLTPFWVVSFYLRGEGLKKFFFLSGCEYQLPVWQTSDHKTT